MKYFSIILLIFGCGEVFCKLPNIREYTDVLDNTFRKCIRPIQTEAEKLYPKYSLAYDIYYQCNDMFKTCAVDHKNQFNNEEYEFTNEYLKDIKLRNLIQIGKIVAPHPLCHVLSKNLNDKYNESDFRCLEIADNSVHGCPLNFTDSETDLRKIDEIKLDMFNQKDCSTIKEFTECVVDKYRKNCTTYESELSENRFTNEILSATNCMRYF